MAEHVLKQKESGIGLKSSCIDWSFSDACALITEYDSFYSNDGELIRVIVSTESTDSGHPGLLY